MLVQHTLDLTQFDPVTANLDLLIAATQEFKLPIGPIACQIACTIETRAWLLAKRIGDEALGGHIRALPITTRHASTSQVDFADLAGRDLIPIMI